MFLREDLSKDSEYKSLSPRELEVPRCIWDGLHTRTICEKLGVTRKGVEYHRGNLIKKWECDNIMQVIRLAIRRRILEVSLPFPETIRKANDGLGPLCLLHPSATGEDSASMVAACLST